MQHTRYRPALTRDVQEQCDALANLGQCHRRGPFFSPDGSLSQDTTWRVTTAFDDGASPSTCGPRSRPSQPRSCSAGDTLQYDVPLWPPGQRPPTASPAGHGTGQRPLAPPCGSLAHDNDARPPSRHGLLGAGAYAPPPVV